MKDRGPPLKTPADLRHHVLLAYDDPEVRHPWLHWRPWLEVEGLADLKPAGRISFSGYEQIIAAAIAGHGVALGRTPLVKDALASGELVAPFKRSADPARAYYAVVSPNARSRAEVADFISWLKREAATEPGGAPGARPPK
jgi:DNA-binding transcriptional LysR family regulator